MSLVWTTSRPTVDGLYWHQPLGTYQRKAWLLVHVAFDGPRVRMQSLGTASVFTDFESFCSDRCRWAGPIPEPVEAEIEALEASR